MAEKGCTCLLQSGACEGAQGRELAACFWGDSQVTSVPQLEFEDH